MTPGKTRGYGSVFDLDSPVGACPGAFRGHTKNDSGVRHGGLIAIKYKANTFFFLPADFHGKIPQIKGFKSAWIFCEDQRKKINPLGLTLKNPLLTISETFIS